MKNLPVKDRNQIRIELASTAEKHLVRKHGYSIREANKKLHELLDVAV